MKEDMGHGQEVTHLAFVATDLPLLAHKNPQWTTRSVVIENVVSGNRALCLLALKEQKDYWLYK